MREVLNGRVSESEVPRPSWRDVCHEVANAHPGTRQHSLSNGRQAVSHGNPVHQRMITPRATSAGKPEEILALPPSLRRLSSGHILMLGLKYLISRGWRGDRAPHVAGPAGGRSPGTGNFLMTPMAHLIAVDAVYSDAMKGAGIAF